MDLCWRKVIDTDICVQLQDLGALATEGPEQKVTISSQYKIQPAALQYLLLAVGNDQTRR